MMVCGKAKIISNVNYVALEMNMAKGLTKDNQPSSTITMLAYYQWFSSKGKMFIWINSESQIFYFSEIKKNREYGASKSHLEALD